MTANYLWRVSQSFTPNKAKLIDGNGKALSALMSTQTAKKICTDHNQIVAYLTQAKEPPHE